LYRYGWGMNNFGVQLFLDTFLGYSVRPRGRMTSTVGQLYKLNPVDP
jgi:peptide subunit release factor RF-3